MPWTPPANVTPLDRRNPSVAQEADVQACLAWLESFYPGGTATGVLITVRATNRTYKVGTKVSGAYELDLLVSKADVDAAAAAWLDAPIVLNQAEELVQDMGGLVLVGQSGNVIEARAAGTATITPAPRTFMVGGKTYTLPVNRVTQSGVQHDFLAGAALETVDDVIADTLASKAGADAARNDTLALIGIPAANISETTANPPLATNGAKGAKRTSTGGIIRLEQVGSAWVERGEALPSRSYVVRAAGYTLVEDFGAVGDGVTDDTAALQAAIDSGLRIAGRPGAVYGLGPGFTLDFGPEVGVRSIGLTFHVNLDFDLRGASIKALSSIDFMIRNEAVMTGLNFRNGIVDGNNLAGGVVLGSPSVQSFNATIANIKFTRIAHKMYFGQGVTLWSWGKGSAFDRNRFENTAAGAIIAFADSMSVSHNSFDGVGLAVPPASLGSVRAGPQNAFFFYAETNASPKGFTYGTNMTVVGNEGRNLGRMFMEAWNDNPTTKVWGGVWSDNRAQEFLEDNAGDCLAFSLVAMKNATITGNHAYDAPGIAFELFGENIDVSGNHAVGGGLAVSAEHLHNSRIHHNSFIARQGVYLNGGVCSGVTFDHNTIHASYGHGVFIDNASTDLLFDQNIITALHNPAASPAQPINHGFITNVSGERRVLRGGIITSTGFAKCLDVKDILVENVTLVRPSGRNTAAELRAGVTFLNNTVEAHGDDPAWSYLGAVLLNGATGSVIGTKFISKVNQSAPAISIKAAGQHTVKDNDGTGWSGAGLVNEVGANKPFVVGNKGLAYGANMLAVPTLASLPPASAVGANTQLIVSNPAASKGGAVYSDGAAWRYVSDGSAV